MTWDDVVERWLPLVEEMERMGLDDYAVPEIFRAAEDRIARLGAERSELLAVDHAVQSRVAALEAENERLQKENAALRANVSKSVLRRLDAQFREE